MDMDEVLAYSIQSKLRPRSPLSSQACIFRVPQVLSQQSEGAFYPNIVSIGPLHYGYEHLMRMEEFKRWYLRELLSRTPTPTLQTSLNTCTKAIRQLEERARECYAEDLSYLSSDGFVEMMLVDGCFVLELFLRKAINGLEAQRDDPISNTPWMDTYLRVDLMLLENQIPWFVLEKLFDLTVPHLDKSPSLSELAFGFFRTSMPMTVTAKSSSRLDPKHLLDFLRNSIISVSAEVEVTVENDQYWEVIPSVTDLAEAGVKFKKGNPEDILNIKFKDGLMEIPPFLIQGSTARLFRNLIAYEQCNHLLPSRITSFVVLLDNLLNSSKDVHFLGDTGILENWMGTEEDASLFFSRVWKGATLQKFYYASLCQKVNAYYRTSWHKWRATLKHTYFNNPWTIISLIGAIVLLILTVLQTIFAILSYH